MTRQEAIQCIKHELLITVNRKDLTGQAIGEALDMAIEALEQEPIIHCKNCKYWHEWENGTGSCHRSDIMWVGSDYDDYCSFGNRKESEE